MSDKKIFPNLATRTTDPGKLKNLDEAIRAELMEAGILGADGQGDYGNFLEQEFIRKRGGEVPTSIFVAKHRWTFTRAWYYYVAKGPGIPPLIAEEFHQRWGREVRVDGHCGCPSPLEWEKGFAVGMYHIDTQAGLNAFVKLLASIHIQEDPTPPSSPTSAATDSAAPAPSAPLESAP